MRTDAGICRVHGICGLFVNSKECYKECFSSLLVAFCVSCATINSSFLPTAPPSLLSFRSSALDQWKPGKKHRWGGLSLRASDPLLLAEVGELVVLTSVQLIAAATSLGSTL